MAGSRLCVSRAATFQEFVAEVNEGRSVPLVKREDFAPLRWTLFLRVLYFMSRYRQIAGFRGEPVAVMLESRRVLLDRAGHASRAFLAVVSACGLARQ